MDAVGIASFGPIDPNPVSSTYGYITTTPKSGWANVDFAGAVQSALDVPVGFDTDVNAAAQGEWKWGAAQGLDTFLYLTVGTGIGGGGLANGKPMRGLLHPEMGHIALPRDPSIDPFEGVCPYHGDCLEGLASGPAIQARWGTPVEELPDDHPAWELEAHYLGMALASFICVLSPQRIVLGGGVMKHAPLIRAVREKTRGPPKRVYSKPIDFGGDGAVYRPAGAGRSIGRVGRHRAGAGGGRLMLRRALSRSLWSLYDSLGTLILANLLWFLLTLPFLLLTLLASLPLFGAVPLAAYLAGAAAVFHNPAGLALAETAQGLAEGGDASLRDFWRGLRAHFWRGTLLMAAAALIAAALCASFLFYAGQVWGALGVYGNMVAAGLTVWACAFFCGVRVLLVARCGSG